MNPRILKKLSKRAAPLLPLLGDHRQQFRADGGGNYHSVFMPDRRHWERSPCHPSYEGSNRWSTPRGREIVFVTRGGRTIVMRPPCDPLKGTMMAGGMSGYYEPEWDEQTAWEALRDAVHGHFVEFVNDEDGGDLYPTRHFDGIAAYFDAAAEIIAERQAEELARQERRAKRIHRSNVDSMEAAGA